MKDHIIIPFSSDDWGLFFRILSRCMGLLIIIYLTYTLKTYVDMGGIGALGSTGQFIIGIFFLYLLFITDVKHHPLFLFGLIGLVLTF